MSKIVLVHTQGDNRFWVVNFAQGTVTETERDPLQGGGAEFLEVETATGVLLRSQSATHAFHVVE